MMMVAAEGVYEGIRGKWTSGKRARRLRGWLCWLLLWGEARVARIRKGEATRLLGANVCYYYGWEVVVYRGK